MVVPDINFNNAKASQKCGAFSFCIKFTDISLNIRKKSGILLDSSNKYYLLGERYDSIGLSEYSEDNNGCIQ